ncbi:hypothetical protein [Hymenobacter crusticola]|nr:hypothetical protein [Hymenobacter crusticola]
MISQVVAGQKLESFKSNYIREYLPTPVSPQGRVHVITVLDSVIDEQRAKKRYEDIRFIYNRHSNVIQVDFIRAHTDTIYMQYKYDQLGRIIEQNRPADKYRQQILYYYHDKEGISEEIVFKVPGVRSEKAVRYYQNGKLIRLESHAQVDNPLIVTHYEYDLKGNLIKEALINTQLDPNSVNYRQLAPNEILFPTSHTINYQRHYEKDNQLRSVTEIWGKTLHKRTLYSQQNDTSITQNTKYFFDYKSKKYTPSSIETIKQIQDLTIRESNYFDEDSTIIQSHFKTYYINKLPIRGEVLFTRNSKLSEQEYSYLYKYDKAGNWKQMAYLTDNKLTRVIQRIIEYY